MKNKLIVIGLVLGMTTAWALAQEGERAPRRLESPREAGVNGDREMRAENQGSRPGKTERREAKRMAKRQDRGEFSQLPPGRGRGGPGYHGGQEFRPPGRGPGFNQPHGNAWGAGRHPEICPECKRPIGSMGGRGPGMGQPQPHFGGPGFGPNRQFGRGMGGPYAWNNQRPGPRDGMGSMNRPPMNGERQFRGGRQFDGQDRGPAMGRRGGPPDRQSPMLRDGDSNPSPRNQDGPRPDPGHRDAPQPDDRGE